VTNPELTGKVQFDKVNVAMDGVPNGLSNMNGTLVFNGDRLQVDNLTATTGGGTLKLGGSIRYKNGVYADLTATGDVVRVRLYGLSATANANLKLQGGQDSVLLSGSILLTRFGIGPDVDFAAFGSPGGVSPPPDPNSPANKIRLDVHVTSAPQLDFQNSYAKLAGTVDLTIRGTAAVPSVLGRIEINEGSATFAGTKYQLQRGDIYFTNPVRIDPIIDLDATAQVENYDRAAWDGDQSEADVSVGAAAERERRVRAAGAGTDAGGGAALSGAAGAAGHRSDDERSSGRGAECYSEQPGSEVVWRGQREDRSGVRGDAGAIVGEDHGAAADFAADYGDVCDERQYVGAAVDPGAV
jgi:hypothetical protein